MAKLWRRRDAAEAKTGSGYTAELKTGFVGAEAASSCPDYGGLLAATPGLDSSGMKVAFPG